MPLSYPATIRRDAEGLRIAVVGDEYRMLVTGQETGGRYAMWHAIVPPGGGPPPHIHSREEESFYVLEGEITFMIEGETFVGGPGTFANLPLGSLHNFHNATDKPARMIISCAPAGFEQMFLEAGRVLQPGESATPPTKEEIEKLLAIAPKYGVEIKAAP
jgi:quercetin dioxygenase-like cupin family protein